MLNKTIYGFGYGCSSDDAISRSVWDANTVWRTYKADVYKRYQEEADKYDPEDYPRAHAVVNAIMSSGGYAPIDFERERPVYIIDNDPPD